jgi:D-glycero-alpha-D-manno-heptose-7-phosphate kinase
MIISRTPFRVSFFGGGTDYPAWYRANRGAVLSTTINKYCYITCRYLPPFHDFKYLVRYYRREEAQSIEEIQHPSVRECLRDMEIAHGVDIVHHADLPARSGLGSSSTFTVGLLHALYALKNQMPSKRQLAINAIRIEQDRIGENVGSQDQTAAAFGGFNRIDFGGVQQISVKPLVLSPQRLASLQQHMMLFFTGYSRTADEVVKEQIARMGDKQAEMRQMLSLVEDAEAVLTQSEDRPDEFGRLLHEQWMIKRSISSKVTTAPIDEMYEAGCKAGASGGKLLGAGGGGFLMLFAAPERQAAVRAALSKLLYVPCHFEHLGSQIIYFSHEDELAG